MLRTLSTAALAILIAGPAVAADWTAANVTDPLLGVIGKSAHLFGTATRDGKTFVAIMSVRCRDNSIDVYFHRDGHVRYYQPSARYRLDTRPVAVLPVNESTDRQAFGAWRGGGIGFVKSFAGAEALKLVVTDRVDGEENVFTFDLKGSTAALEAVATACKWSTAAAPAGAPGTTVAAAPPAARAPEIDLKAAVAACLNTVGASPSVTLTARTDSTGRIVSINIADAGRYNNDPAFRAAADAIHRALINPRCQTYTLQPVTTYAVTL